MAGLYLLIPTLLAVFLSYLMVRAGAIALMMTGMEQSKARFQALSAFTRAGFTTKEAELVMNHPQRRRIITWLIIAGNAGLVAIIVTATSSIATSTGYNLPITVVALISGTLVLYIYLSRSGFARWWDSFIEKRFVKSRVVEEAETEDLLHFIEGYGLVKLIVAKDSVFIGHSLREVNTTDNEFFVIGIERGKEWISLPRAREIINDGDKLVIYGNLNTLKRFFE